MTTRSGDTLPTRKHQRDGTHILRRRADLYQKSRATTLPEFVPDALQDSNRIRSTATKKKMGYGVGLIPRLLTATEHQLVHITVPLWNGPASDLYDHVANDRARNVAAAVVGRAAAYVKLERGDHGNLHLHIAMDARATPLLPVGSTITAVHDLQGLMGYLSKPGDSRACMRRTSVPHTGTPLTLPQDPDLLLLAYQDFMLSRARAGGRQFPRQSWTLNLPRMATGLQVAVV